MAITICVHQMQSPKDNRSERRYLKTILNMSIMKTDIIKCSQPVRCNEKEQLHINKFILDLLNTAVTET